MTARHGQTSLDISLNRLDEAIGLSARRYTADEVLAYLYAVVSSPSYRSTYEELLKTDFPRVPLVRSESCFRRLSKIGGDLVTVHLMEAESLGVDETRVDGPLHSEVESVSYSRNTVWIDKAKTKGFAGIPNEIWSFQIGGYQVCEKWLKDRQAKGGTNPRPGRVLTKDDIEHYQKIVVAISETIRIMDEIDEVIEEHGGWPGAFVGQEDH